MIDALINFLKWRKFVKNGILWQTSYLENFRNKFVEIQDYLMKKKINSIFDFRDEYFWLYVASDYLFYEKILELNLQEKLKVEGEWKIIDKDKGIEVKTVARDLLLITVDKGSVLLGTQQLKNYLELENYILEDYGKFIQLDLSLLNDYSIEELNTIIQTGVFSERALFKRFFINKEEQRKKRKHLRIEFLTYKVEEIDFNKLLNLDISVSDRTLSNFVLVGGTGSGKTFTLFHLLFNVALSDKAKRIIVFDTQHLFNEYFSKLKEEYFNVLKEKWKVLVINEKNLFLSEIAIINAVNFLLESWGFLESKAKKSLLSFSLSDVKDVNDLLVRLQELISYLENKKDFKEIWKIEKLKKLVDVLAKVRVKDYSFYSLLGEKYFIVLQFDSIELYELMVYLFLNNLYKQLTNRKDKETYLFLDETQKYLESEYIQQFIIKLLQEKRQYGLHSVWTSIKYSDLSELNKYAHLFIMNDFSDVYLLNNFVRTLDVSLEKHKEKIVIDKTTNSWRKILFENYLFET